MKIGLALSGGGVRGAAHIGVLQALNEQGTYPSVISGTSSGSIIAAMYAAGYTPFEMKDILCDFTKETKNENGINGICYNKTQNLIDVDYLGLIEMIVSFLFMKNKDFQGFLKGNKLLKFLRQIFSAKGIYTLKDIPMPFAIAALEINYGKHMYFSNVKFADNVITDIPIEKAVMASCSYPVVFRPQKIDDYIFVDGGVVDNLPVEVLKTLGSDYNIAVAFPDNSNFKDNKHKNFISIAERSINLLRKELENITDTDINLKIDVSISNTSLLEMSKLLMCYRQGYIACKEKIYSTPKQTV